jgi:hypothetical protein
MATQIQIKLFTLCTLLGSSLLRNTIPGQTHCTTSHDYGFDFNEDELARETLAPLSTSLADQPIHSVVADEFETLYLWFNS